MIGAGVDRSCGWAPEHIRCTDRPASVAPTHRLPPAPPAGKLSCHPMELQHRSLEQMLLEQGRVSPEDLRKVRKLQQERGERLERLLLDLGFISEEDLQPLLARYLGVTAITRKEFPSEAVPIGKLSLKYLRRAKVMPLVQQNGTL